MAIVGTVYAGTQSKWGFVEEATFGTAIADNQNFAQFEGPVPSVNYGIIRDKDQKFNGSRVLQGSEKYHTDGGGLREISFSDLIVRKLDLGDLLYAVCQNVTEGASTPYTKTYTIDITTTQPDFASDAGYFATIGIYDPIASYMRKFTSCILRDLTLSADLSGDGRLRASGTWISGFSASTTANFSGTWAYNTQAYLDYHSMSTKQIEDTDVVVYGWDITVNNGAERVGSASGDAETYGIPMYNVTGNIRVKYDTSVQGLIADSIAGTGREIDLAVGTGGQDGHFSALLYDVYFDDISKEYGDPKGQLLNVPFQARNLTSSDLALFTLSDADDRAW